MSGRESQFVLFEGEVSGPQGPSLAACRALAARIDDILGEDDEIDWPDFDARCERYAREARALGAHSVARALEWLGNPLACDRSGFEAADLYVERATAAWLRRIELRRAR